MFSSWNLHRQRLCLPPSHPQDDYHLLIFTVSNSTWVLRVGTFNNTRQLINPHCVTNPSCFISERLSFFKARMQIYLFFNLMEDALSNPITCYPRSPGEECLSAQYPYVPKIIMMIIEQHPLDAFLPNASVPLRTHNKEDWAGIWQASSWNLACAEALLGHKRAVFLVCQDSSKRGLPSSASGSVKETLICFATGPWNLVQAPKEKATCSLSFCRLPFHGWDLNQKSGLSALSTYIGVFEMPFSHTYVCVVWVEVCVQVLICGYTCVCMRASKGPRLTPAVFLGCCRPSSSGVSRLNPEFSHNCPQDS